MAAWDLKPDRCTQLSSCKSCCAGAQTRKRGREGEGDNRGEREASWGPAESWLDGTMEELLYRIRVLKTKYTFLCESDQATYIITNHGFQERSSSID